MRLAAFNTGHAFHALDHIAPLAEILHIPLFITEEQNQALAKRFYPQVHQEYMPDLEHRFQEIADRFDGLIECKYWPIHLKSLFQTLFNKKMQLIFCPHGQSDKGYQTPLLAPYAWQDLVLLYGDLLRNMLQELAVPIANYAYVGNYRLQMYQKHQPFYDALFAEVISLPKKNKTLLYAPTWRDADGASSFFHYAKKLLQELPSDWNLIVKPHPLIEQRDPAHFYAIATLVEKKPNAFLLSEFPPIYPILARADIYLGDASSIGYDFLAFKRPLYFFPTNHPGRLHTIGQIIDPDQNIYTQLQNFSPASESLYSQAFGAPLCEERLRNNVYQALQMRTATCS